MLFEHVDGRTPDITDLDPVMTAVAALGQTPGPPGLPRLVDEFAEDFTGWRDIAGAASWTAVTAAYPELVGASIDVLAAREKRWTEPPWSTVTCWTT